MKRQRGRRRRRELTGAGPGLSALATAFARRGEGRAVDLFAVRGLLTHERDEVAGLLEQLEGGNPDTGRIARAGFPWKGIPWRGVDLEDLRRRTEQMLRFYDGLLVVASELESSDLAAAAVAFHGAFEVFTEEA